MSISALQDPPQAEALVNWSRLMTLMQAHDVDVLVAGSPQNVTYLSDFWSMSQWTRPSAQAFVLVRRGERRDVQVITPAGNADLAGRLEARPPTRLSVAGRFTYDVTDEAVSLDDEARRFDTALASSLAGQTAEEILLDALADAGSATIAIERKGLPASLQNALPAALPQARIVDGDTIISQTRAIKTAREIDLLHRAARATERAIAATFAGVHGPVTERDLLRNYLAELAHQDALPLFTALNTGPRSALPNGQATDRTVQPGDLVRFDAGCRYGLYASDIARIAVFGEPTEKQATYYGAVVAGLEAAIETAGPGVRAADCFEAAVGAVRDAGIAHYDRTHCGHGIGIENYDAPAVTPSSEDVLEPGMVICLETPYYELGWGGVQAEDTLLITDTGVDRFTRQPTELVELG